MSGIRSQELAMPIRDNFVIKDYPKTSYLYNVDTPGFTPKPVCIERILEEISVMSSKARPKKIAFVGDDGIKRYFLCKYEKNSDMRKESRVISIIEAVNRIFEKDPKSRRLGLKLPTYSLIPVGSECGLVE